MSGPVSYNEYLRAAAVDPATIEHFLDPDRPSWFKFDPECGYRLSDFEPLDGISGCATIVTAGNDGSRTARMYQDRPCRISTYGDSFTQGTQVSDGETWQEQIAAHFGEPIKNFGVGGYGVCQAHLRLRANEDREGGAEYVILTIWGDDHIRSLMRCRHAAIYPIYHNSGAAFHANFWSNIEMDLDVGRFALRENALGTAEDLGRMSDPEWMVEALEGDLAVRMLAYLKGWVVDLDAASLRALADALGVSGVRLEDAQPPKGDVLRLLDAYSLGATEWIVDEVQKTLDVRGKKLLVVLIDTERAMFEVAEGRPRYDQQIVDFLAERGIPTVDMNVAHVEDHRSFSIPFDQYLSRYVSGHYAPVGNRFFADTLIPAIVDWVDPRPPTYAKAGESAPSYGEYVAAAHARGER